MAYTNSIDATLLGGTVTANWTQTVLIRAWNGASYTTFATLTSASPATFDLADSVTKASNYIYRAGGTDVAIADGGTGLSATPTDGQLLIGKTSTNAYVQATLTAGSGISVTNGSGTITIANTAGSLTWNDQTTTPVTLAVNNGYIMNSGSLITATLPATAAVGSIFAIVGKGTGKYKINVAAGQTIYFGNQACTTGTGNIAATDAHDCVELVCVTADTNFVVRSSVGNLSL